MRRLALIIPLLLSVMSTDLRSFAPLRNLYWHEKAAALLKNSGSKPWLLADLAKELNNPSKNVPQKDPKACLDLCLRYAKPARYEQELAFIFQTGNRMRLQEFIAKHRFAKDQEGAGRILAGKAATGSLHSRVPQAVAAFLVVTGMITGAFGVYKFVQQPKNTKKDVKKDENKKKPALQKVTVPVKALPSLIDRQGTIALPEPLKNIEDCDIIHLRSMPQNDGTRCGYFANFNAYAIEKLYKENRPITAENIEKIIADEKLIEKYAQNPHMLGADEVNALIGQLNTHSHALRFHQHPGGGRNKKELVIGIEGKKDQNGRDITERLYEENEDAGFAQEDVIFKKEIIQESIGKQANSVTHFICHTMNGIHWSLITVIKKEGYKPVIILTDSLHNHSITTTDDQAIYMNILYRMVFHPNADDKTLRTNYSLYDYDE